MIKAIIFDCFGVLVQGTLEQFRDTYLGGDNKRIQEARDLDRLSNLGKLSYDEFISSMSKLANISAKEAATFLNNNPRNEPLLAYIRDKLKPGYKIGFLSNASDDWLEELFRPEQATMFDSVVLSYKTGYAKPDSEIFELSCEELDVLPKEAVMVDDIERYCTAAKELGMQAIWYQDFLRFKQELEKILAADSDN